ncbi:MAG: molybdopterin molybdotransferase MoeA [Woeseiaceae bacterium]|nr:molybdopterin molybdotransferase MoeA [Woeseiaceae bacterium]
MLTTIEAQATILREIGDLGSERVATGNCVGRMLRQAVAAERDQPPFDRVMMDGIAVRFDELSAGTRSFAIEGTQHAGDPQMTLPEGRCIEIMTGASLPDGADCIIPVERISTEGGEAVVESDYTAQRRQFIHPRASDHAAEAALLRPGKRIMPADVAIIVSAGLADVEVSSVPRIRVISTGNELVPAGEPIEDHQIRLSNGPALVAMLTQHGYLRTEHDHLLDDREAMRERIAEHLGSSDVLVLSGGVSMGKADFVPEVLKELGVQVVFHRVSQRPGKPMWFGIGPSGQSVFALPGNPVSNLVCCRQYVIPALHKASGGTALPPEFATLSQPVSFKPALTCFLPTRIVSNAAGQLLALPTPTNTSGDFASLTGTEGYLELALEQTDFPSGTTVPLHRWQHPAH